VARRRLAVAEATTKIDPGRRFPSLGSPSSMAASRWVACADNDSTIKKNATLLTLDTLRTKLDAG